MLAEAWHWLEHYLGLTTASGPWYSFWSGIGSDFGELTIVAAVVGLYRHHNCHEKGCWRIGKFSVDGTPYTACRKHHPALPDKAAPGDIAHAHAGANGSVPYDTSEGKVPYA
jgi:hypothetical protein